MSTRHPDGSRSLESGRASAGTFSVRQLYRPSCCLLRAIGEAESKLRVLAKTHSKLAAPSLSALVGSANRGHAVSYWAWRQPPWSAGNG